MKYLWDGYYIDDREDDYDYYDEIRMREYERWEEWEDTIEAEREDVCY